MHLNFFLPPQVSVLPSTSADGSGACFGACVGKAKQKTLANVNVHRLCHGGNAEEPCRRSASRKDPTVTLWQSIFTTGVPMLGVHIETTPLE